MSQLTPLIKTALLGTQREPLPDAPNGSPIADLMKELNGSAPEAALLSMAGALRLSELAGQLPRRVSTPTAAGMPFVDLSPCSAACGQRLAAILDGRFQIILAEFLRTLASAGKRAPDEMLPLLLNHGVKAPSMRHLILPVLGQAGRWLASQHPAWGYASVDADSWDGLARLWQAGSGDQRNGLLVQLRSTRPEWGLALAQMTWKAESTAIRSKFIRSLEIGLSAADEPFFEAALDDRELAIRRKASTLLAQIPESRLLQRMAIYADDVVRWSPKQGLTLLEMPDSLPPEMMRDGVPTLVVGHGAQTVRGTQAVAILGAIPLDYWEAAWGITPDEIVQAALNSALPRTVIRGFASAASRQRNLAWARALLIGDGFSGDVIRLAALLPVAELNALVCEADANRPTFDNSIMARLLNRWGSAWSVEASRRWIDALVPRLEESAPPGAILAMVIKQFARFCPVTLADEAADALVPPTRAGSLWGTLMREAVAMLRFRRAMLAEFEDLL